jgi:hypothetical protein
MRSRTETSSTSFSGHCRAKFSKSFKSFQTRPPDLRGFSTLGAGCRLAVATTDVICIREQGKRVKELDILACDE